MNEKADQFKLSGLERIKKVHLTLTAFTPENGLVTPTMKIKRYNIQKHFERELHELYF